MERNQTCSRRMAAMNATTAPSGPAAASAGRGSAFSTATRNPSGSVARRWLRRPSSGPNDGGVGERPTRTPYSERPACQTPAHAGRSPGRAGRRLIAGAPAGGGSVTSGVTSGVPARSRRLGCAAPRRTGCLALQLGRHEHVEIPVEHGRRVGRLHARPVVLDHLVRMEDIAPDLVAPAGLDVLALELAQLDLLLLQAPFQEPGREHLCRGLAVLRRRALVLACLLYTSDAAD